MILNWEMLFLLLMTVDQAARLKNSMGEKGRVQSSKLRFWERQKELWKIKMNLKTRCSVSREQVSLGNSLFQPAGTCMDGQIEISVPRGVRAELILVPQVEALCLKTDHLFFQNINKTAPGVECEVLELY